MEEKNKEINKVIVKVSGERTRVLKIIKKIESMCPLYIEGREKPNENGDGIHVFLTVAEPERAEEEE